MASSKFNIDYASAVNLTLTASSATVALPINSQLIGVTTNVNARFRVTPLAQATAVAADPLLTPNSEIQIIRIGGSDTNVSAVLDLSVTPAANQFLSCFRVFEA
jgi:hypothetical protein